MEQKIPFIDANVFLRFLIFDRQNPQLSKKAKRVIEKIQKGEITVQLHILTIAEVVFVLEHFYEVEKNEIRKKVEPILSLEHLIFSEKVFVLEALRLYQEKNVDFADSYTYVLMKTTGINGIYTFDAAHFKRFPEVEIL